MHITLKDVYFEYVGQKENEGALRGVSLCVERGEFLAVIGHNGSGKSTLGRLMNALLTPRAGSVTVCGMNTGDETLTLEIRKRAGMVFQNPDNQLVASIVEEDVGFGLENIGVPPLDIRRRVDDALDAVGMGAYKLHAPHMLSGGQKQRVAIAGVLAMRPDTIILDEPTAMLDPSGRREIMDTVRALNAQGITIVWITHFMDEAVDANRVVVMEGGRVFAEGAPRDVFARADALMDIGLDVPFASMLAARMRRRGVALSGDILTEDELVEGLCLYKRGGAASEAAAR